jgi:hypothetical protein
METRTFHVFLHSKIHQIKITGSLCFLDKKSKLNTKELKIIRILSQIESTLNLSLKILIAIKTKVR